MPLNEIHTKRLILIPATYELLQSIYDHQIASIALMGLRAHPQWPMKDTLDILSFLLQSAKRNQPCHCAMTGFDTIWMIVRKDNKTIIGDLGFKGNPNCDGEVEIGYGLVETQRRRGYGYEAVDALTEWGLSHDCVRAINAVCFHDNLGSIRILQKVGMHEESRNKVLIFWKREKRT